MAGLCYCKAGCVCEQNLIDSIKGVFVPRPTMEIGSKFHKAIETGSPEGFDGKSFVDALKLMDGGRLAKALANHRGVHEGKFAAVIAGVTVVGKYDYLTAGVVRDWKATQGYSAGDYTDSLQWRMTLAALPEVTFFRYESFRVWEDEPGEPYSVKYLSPGQEFTRYPNLMADCEGWVRSFCGFVSLRSLGSFVEDRASNECPV